MEKNSMQSNNNEHPVLDTHWKELDTPILAPKSFFKRVSSFFGRKEKVPAAEKAERGIVNPTVDQNWDALNMPIGDVLKNVFGSVWDKFSKREKEEKVSAVAATMNEPESIDAEWKELSMTPGQVMKKAWENIRPQKRQEVTAERQGLEAMQLNTPADVEKAKSGIASVWSKIKHYGKESYLAARWSVLGGSMEADLVENDWKLKGLQEKMGAGMHVNPNEVASTEAKIRDLQERIGSKIATSKEFAQRAQIVPLEPVENNSVEHKAA